MVVPDKWVTVIDGAGIERRVRRVDAREIEEGKARRAGEVKVVEAKPEPEPLVEVDDQSVEPKVSSKAKKAK
jgi:hypothetical protein